MSVLTTLVACAGGSPVVSGPEVPGFVRRDVIDVTSPDRVPALEHPMFETPSEAAAWLADPSPVIAVTGEGSARAYPIAVLMRHEVVNDVIDGRAIAVTYFPLADGAAVWDRRVGERALTLRASGKIYRSDSVLFDAESGSLWVQLLGVAVAGPMKGARLSLLPSQIVSFKEYRTTYPDGDVLARPEPRADYDRDPYAGYRRRRAPVPNYLLAPVSDRAPAMRRLVVGFDRDQPYASIPGVSVCPALPSLVVIAGGGASDPLDAATVSGGRIEVSAGVFAPVSMGVEVALRSRGTQIVDDATMSNWSALGVATDGPLKGSSLRRLPSVTALASVWLALRPETLLVCAPPSDTAG